MIHYRCLIPFLVLATLLSACADDPVFPEIPTNEGQGSIEVLLLDSVTGRECIYANVVLTSEDNGKQWGTMSLENKPTRLEDVASGHYALAILYLGYRKVVREIDVFPGENIHLTIQMERADHPTWEFYKKP